jgi:hypothetical protein
MRFKVVIQFGGYGPFMTNRIKDPTMLDEMGAAFAIVGMLLFSWLLRPWYGRWGAPHGEAWRALAGEMIVPEPLDNGICRLWMRSCDSIKRTFANTMIWRVITGSIHFLMEHCVLIGVNQPAEA